MINLKNNYKTTTIKEFLKHKGLSSRTITQLSKKLGILKINGEPKILKDIITKKQKLQIEYVEENFTQNYPKSSEPINIVYEDKNILIVDKPSNLPTIPSYSYADSLASRVINYLGKTTFRAMNRLDADTTGIVIIAKNVITENILEKFGKIKKYYVAIVEGKTKFKGKINANIKDDENLKKRVIANDGLPAITFYKRLKYNKNDNSSLVKCHLKYGRTNQIRCHFSHISHPLKYDTKYGSLFQNKTFYLRCYKLIFIHPYTCKKITIKLHLN